MRTIRGKITKYSLVFLFFIWLLGLGYLYYSYVISSAPTVPAKGGTLIEGVTSNISYLPYVRSTDADLFYQGLLFQGCMSYFGSGYQVIYEPDLCKVISQDNKTFVVSLNTTGAWSDSTPISIDDVMFTYEDIIKANFWDIPNLRNYEKIEIEKISDNSLSVTFPGASVDNYNFFTNYILPKHKLKGVGLNYYLTEFKEQPVTSSCASIKSDHGDETSLVFDVNGCKGWLSYYQVKKIESTKELETAKLVDITVSPTALEGYKNNKLILNKYIGVFFNMQQGKLGIYGRKNFIALVNYHLFKEGNNPGIIEEHFLFDAFPKILTDKSAIISSVAEGTGSAKRSLEQMPNLINIENPGEKNEFALSEITGETFLTVKSAKPYDTLGIIANDQPQHDIESSSNTIAIKLVAGKTIFEGINTYIIRGTGKESDETVATISVYYKTNDTVHKDNAIKVIYYNNDPLITQLVSKIRNFLAREGIAGYFDFQGISSPEDFEGKLASKEYDIVLRGIDLGLKKDISNLLLTDNPLINPSLYLNSNLASQINQFFATTNVGSQNNIKREIDRLYLNDLPFVLLGKAYSLLHSRAYIYLDPEAIFYEHDYRRKILHNVVLNNKPQIKKENAFNFRAFFRFVRDEMTK